MKKRLLPLSLLMVLGLVACGTTPSSSETPSSEQPSSEVPSSEQPSSEEPSSSEVESLFMDVYFEAPETWATSINIYLWNGAGNLAAWPGTAMENVEDNLYKFNYDVNLYPNVIFNDGSNQTADLTSPTDPNFARYADGEWVSTIPEEPGVTMSISNKDALTAEWHLGDEPRTIDFIFEPEININAAILSGDLVISSSNTEAVAINGRAIQAVAEGEATITATYLNNLTDSFNVTVLEKIEVVLPVTSLEDLWAGIDDETLKKGDEVRIQGIIASTMLQEDGHIHSGVYLQNGDIPMPLYAGGLGDAWLELGLQVGDAIDVTGVIDVYNGLTQVKPNKLADGGVKILEDHNIATPTVLQLTGDNFSADALAHEAGRLVEAKEAVYVSGAISEASEHASISFKLPKADGSFQDATLRYNYHVGTEAGEALKATIDGLDAGDIVNLKGTLLWYNGPQITPTFSTISASECVTFVREGTLPAPTSITVKGETSVEIGSSMELTVEVNEGADPSVNWASSDETIATVDEHGIVTGVATGKATITATSTQDETVKGTLEIEVLASSEPPIYAATTIADIINFPVDEMTQAFAISGVTVKSWNGSATDGGQYGNFNITDGTTDILVYGATTSADALAWNGEKYVYTNPKNFATDELTSTITIGSELELIVVVTSYKGTKQFNAIVTKVGETGEGNPASQPLPVYVEKIADATGHAAAEMTQIFAISGVTVKSWRGTATDGGLYGNFNITDGTTDILVYGATATADALTWDGAKYVYTNPKNFATNELTSTITIGSTLDLLFVVTSYQGTKQINAIVLDVVNAGDTPVEPEDPSEPSEGDTATFTWDDNGVELVSFSTSQVVYKHGGITLTNDKGSSTSDCINGLNNNGSKVYSMRVYKSSDLTISAEKEFTKVTITFDTYQDGKYVMADGDNGAVVEGDTATFTLTAANSLKLTSLANQVRIETVTVYFA